MDRYEKMHRKLLRLIPTLSEISEYAKLKSSGFMDLHVDILDRNDKYTDIALAHNYRHPSGDTIPDPDMRIRVWSHNAIEALSYQDTFGYQEVYSDFDPQTGEPRKYAPRAKKELNSFLDKWLSNLLEQGHQL